MRSHSQTSWSRPHRPRAPAWFRGQDAGVQRGAASPSPLPAEPTGTASADSQVGSQLGPRRVRGGTWEWRPGRRPRTPRRRFSEARAARTERTCVRRCGKAGTHVPLCMLTGWRGRKSRRCPWWPTEHEVSDSPGRALRPHREPGAGQPKARPGQPWAAEPRGQTRVWWPRGPPFPRAGRHPAGAG